MAAGHAGLAWSMATGVRRTFWSRRPSAMAIDFEVIHFGDPSFDAAFLLNHLLLKTFYGIAGALRSGRRLLERPCVRRCRMLLGLSGDHCAPGRLVVGANGRQIARRIHSRPET